MMKTTASLWLSALVGVCLSCLLAPRICAAEDPDTDGDGLSDYYERGLGRYWIVDGVYTWYQAKAGAETARGHLATITSQAEEDALFQVLGDRLSGRNLWLGATDEAVEGQFAWITGEPWSYTHWGPGEPSGAADDGADYLHLYHAPAIPGDQRDWDDLLEGGGGGSTPWGDNWGYLVEIGYYTDPANPDTDADGYSDGVEVASGSSPVDSASTPGTSTFVWVPPGTFIMGSPETEKDRRPNEGPQTSVTISRGFWIAKLEVTQAEYLEAMGTNPSRFSDDLRRPVERVTWFDAVEYCAKRTRQARAAGRLPSGYAYRLPTEAEWEYACRAGTTTRFYYDNDLDYSQLGEYSWYWSNSGQASHLGGLKQPNALGLHDMSGNMWEWCADWYAEQYPGGATTDPTGPSSGPARVKRGGGWNDIWLWQQRSASRESTEPDHDTSADIGFRIVLGAEGASQPAFDQGMVGYYPFSGNAMDESGRENHGEVTGAVLATDRFGMSEAAYDFDGLTAIIDLGDRPDFDFGSGPFTLACWICSAPLSFNPDKYFIGKYGQPWWESGYGLGTEGSELDYAFILGGNVVERRGSRFLCDKEWHHVVSTYDGAGTLTVFVDGEQEGSATGSAERNPDNDFPLIIGGISARGQEFAGRIDDVRVYSRALSAAEVAALYEFERELPGSVPQITRQPQDLAVVVGGSGTFSVSATGASPLAYQWRKDGVELAGAAGAMLSFAAVAASDTGEYSVVVSNAYGSVTSAAAKLTVRIPPAIVVQPEGQFVVVGSEVQLSASATGTAPLQYQWRKDGVDIPGATGPVLALASAQMSDTGAYAVRVTNPFGTVTSTVAELTVVEPPEYRLTAQSAGGGIVFSDPFLETYRSNATVQVTALPAGGWTFLDWLGDTAGDSREATVIMDDDRCVEARFGTTLTILPAANGAITQVPVAALVPSGHTIQLRALPASGSYFANWTGASSSTANPLSYTVDTAFLSISANFQPLDANQVALTLIVEGSGVVSATPRANRYTKGSSVVLTAAPRADQAFVGWEGDASGAANPLTVVMDASKVITASFTKRPRLDAWTCPGPLHDGAAILILTGDWGEKYAIEVSGNLAAWSTLTTVTNSYGRVQFSDPLAAQRGRSFYRASKTQ